MPSSISPVALEAAVSDQLPWLRELYRHFHRHPELSMAEHTTADRIEQELTRGLEDVDWTGPDADRFRGQWAGEMVPALQQIMNSVNELGDSADRNAAEQEATSSN